MYRPQLKIPSPLNYSRIIKILTDILAQQQLRLGYPPAQKFIVMGNRNSFHIRLYRPDDIYTNEFFTDFANIFNSVTKYFPLIKIDWWLNTHEKFFFRNIGHELPNFNYIEQRHLKNGKY
jgi:hypothetical protein